MADNAAASTLSCGKSRVNPPKGARVFADAFSKLSGYRENIAPMRFVGNFQREAMDESKNKVKTILFVTCFFFVWLLAYLPCIDLCNSYNTAKQIIGFIGLGVVTGSFASILIRIDNLEKKIRTLRSLS